MPNNKSNSIVVILCLIITGAYVYNVINIRNSNINKKEENSEVVEVESYETSEVVEYIEKEYSTCELDETSCIIYNIAKFYNLSNEQGLIAVAISKWETGNYTSLAFKNNNNVGGNMTWTTGKSRLRSFDTLISGIDYFVRNLKVLYFDRGLNTVESIQPSYCPIGAENDPGDLNSNWTRGVNSLLNNIK